MVSEEEIHQFKKFLELSEFKVDSYSYVKNDPPDFELSVGGKHISVELTTLLQPNGQKIAEHRVFVNQLADYLLEASNESIQTGFIAEFSVDLRINAKGKLKRKLINEIVFTLKNAIDAAPQGVKSVDVLDLPESINKLHAFFSPALNGIHKWHHESSWISGTLRQDELVRFVEIKWEKANKPKFGYCRNYDSNWLLFAVQGKPYSDFAGYKDQYDLGGKSGFDEIWVLDIDENHCFKLNTVN